MAILIKIIIALVVFMEVVALIGFVLPKEFKIERSVLIAVPAEKNLPADCRAQKLA